MPANTDRDARLTVVVLLVSVILLASSIGVAIGIGAATTSPSGSETYHLDDTTAVSTQQAVNEFDDTGVTHANVSTPAVTITIAESAEECGYDTSRVQDARNEYLCLDYQEDVPATIRLHIPGDYWHPYVREDKASIRGDAPATLQPTEDGNSTSVTAEFSERTHAVYTIPKDVTAAYYVLDHANSRSETWLGLDFLGHETQWSEIDDAALSDDNTSTRVVNEEGNLLLQYDATPNATERTWLTVPDDSSKSAPVYRMTRTGEPNAVYVVSETTDAPTVRYKSVSGLSQRVDASWRQVRNVRTKLDHFVDETVTRLFGGDSS